MKKIFLVLLFVFMFSFKVDVKADSNYKSYESLTLDSGKLLSEYTSGEFKTYYKKVGKRRFYGWRIHKVNTDVKVRYKTETLFSYFNDGDTPIKYTYQMKKKDVKQQSLSSTGSISVSVGGTVDKFKAGLDESLKITQTSSHTKEMQEDFKLELQVDPGTMLNLYIMGEGKITNGVAAYYVFWLRNMRGGFEVFTITTQYYRLEKVRI